MSQLTDWTAPSYRDADGVQHTVVCDFLDAGVWRVLDVSDREVLLVERLGGFDDKLLQAEHLADDYVEQMRRYLDGARDGQVVAHPLPKPVRLRFTAGKEPLPVKATRPKPARRKRAATPDVVQDQLPIAA